MLKAIIFLIASIIFTNMGSQAKASELWNAYPLRGYWEGLAMGATPPPGVYGVVSTYWADDHFYGNDGKQAPNSALSTLVVNPIVQWVPGLHILGGDYSAVIAQPLVYTSSPGLSGSIGKGNWGTFNTAIIPGQISWKIRGISLKAGVVLYLPDASSTIKDLRDGSLHNGGLPSGDNFMTVEPNLGVSWIRGGWNLTASFHVDVPVTSSTAPGYRYRTGSDFAADYTITKTFGKWTLGAGGHQVEQFEDDRLNGNLYPGHRARLYGLGPIAGYQLGPLNITAIWNRTLTARNTVAGDFLEFRFVTKL
jgi:hypothetical protein